MPRASFRLYQIAVGGNNDIWAYTTYGPQSYLNYYSYTYGTWSQVNLHPITSFTVISFTYDPYSNSTFVYLSDTSHNGPAILRFIKVNTYVYPPSGATYLSSGPLCGYGRVNSIATMPQNNSRNYDIYVGGTFNYAGQGVQVSNIARYSNGIWDPVTTQITAEITALATYGTALYYATRYTAANTPLPIGVINTQPGINNNFPYIPTSATKNKDVLAVFADEAYVYFAGNFKVTLSNGNIVYDVLIFDKNAQSWFGIGIPNNNVGEVNSITVNTVNNIRTLCISGSFSFSISSYGTYSGLAFYNLDAKTWFNAPTAVAVQYGDVLVALLNNTGITEIGGNIDNKSSSKKPYCLGSYDFPDNSVTTIASNLPQTCMIRSLVFYTDPDKNEFLFSGSGGGFQIFNLKTFAVRNLGSNLLDPWSGSINDLIYLAGGKGLNGLNM